MENLDTFLQIGGFLFMAWAGFRSYVAMDRKMNEKITKGDADVTSELTKNQTANAKEIADFKLEAYKEFARKGEVQKGINRIEERLDSVGQEVRQFHKDVMSAIANSKGD